jgi:hypothetical protein
MGDEKVGRCSVIHESIPKDDDACPPGGGAHDIDGGQ